MEDGLEGAPGPQNGERVETPDGQKVFLFRYENPAQENKNPNSAVSHEDLVGAWYTDSTRSLKDYIKKKKPGGVIKVLELPEEDLEALKAINNPVAKTMDIEPVDNYIIPEKRRADSREFFLPVVSKNPDKFLFSDWQQIDIAVDGLVEQLQVKQDS